MAAGAPPTIVVAAASEEARRLWKRALALADGLGEDPAWTLVGGMMVQLHAAEHRRESRFTDDIDVLGDSRLRPPATRSIVETIQRHGGAMVDPPSSAEDLGCRFDLDGETVEVLGTDGVKSDPRTIDRYVTIQVPGGTQALRRSEVVMVSIDGATPVAVRRPDLLGAILIKARAVATERREKFDSDRQDLVLLLSLVADPRALAAGSKLKKSERGWLRDIEEQLAFSAPALQSLFDPETLTHARLAFRLLAESRPKRPDQDLNLGPTP